MDWRHVFFSSPVPNQFSGDHHGTWCPCTHLPLHSGLMSVILAMMIASVGGGVNPHTKCAGKEWKGLILLLQFLALFSMWFRFHKSVVAIFCPSPSLRKQHSVKYDFLMVFLTCNNRTDVNAKQLLPVFSVPQMRGK